MENLESYSDLVNSSFQAIQTENFTTEQLAEQAQQKAEELKGTVQGVLEPFQMEGARETLGTAINYFKSKAVDVVKQKGQDLLQKGKQVISDKASELQKQAEAKVEELKNRGLDQVEELQNRVQGKVSELTQQGEEFAQRGLTRVNQLKSQVEDFGETARSRVTDFQRQAQQQFDEVGDQVDALQSQATEAVQSAQTQATQGLEAVQSQVGDAVQAVQSQADELQTQGTQLVNQGRSAVKNVVDSDEYTMEDAGETPNLNGLTDEQAGDFMDIVEGRSSLGTSLTNEQFEMATKARASAVRRGMVEADPEEVSAVAEGEPDNIFSTSASRAFMEARQPDLLEGDTGLDPDIAEQVEILQSQRELADTSQIAEQFADPDIQAQATQFQDIDPIRIGDPSQAVDTEAQVGQDVEKDVGQNIEKVAAEGEEAAEIGGDVAEASVALDVDPATLVIGAAITGLSLAFQNIFQGSDTPAPPQIKFNVSQQLGI